MENTWDEVRQIVTSPYRLTNFARLKCYGSIGFDIPDYLIGMSMPGNFNKEFI